MDDRLLDDIIINKAEDEKVLFPERLNIRRRTVIENLPKRKAYNRWLKLGITAALFAILVTTAIFLVPNGVNKNSSAAGMTTEEDRTIRRGLAKKYLVEGDFSESISSYEVRIREVFNKNKDSLNKLVVYASEHQEDYEGTFLSIGASNAEEKIRDTELSKDISRLIKEEGIVSITASRDKDSKVYTVSLRFETNMEGFIARLVYLNEKVNNPEVDVEIYSYTRGEKELSGYWYYEYICKNNIKDENEYKKIALDSISEEEKAYISDRYSERVDLVDPEEAIKKVAIKKLDKEERQLVVSVYFITEKDGKMGGITVFLDPDTKEVVGYDSRWYN